MDEQSSVAIGYRMVQRLLGHSLGASSVSLTPSITMMDASSEVILQGITLEGVGTLVFEPGSLQGLPSWSGVRAVAAPQIGAPGQLPQIDTIEEMDVEADEEDGLLSEFGDEGGAWGAPLS